MNKHKQYKRRMIARKIAQKIQERELPDDIGRSAKLCRACRGCGIGLGLRDCPHCNGYGLIRYNGTKFHP